MVFVILCVFFVIAIRMVIFDDRELALVGFLFIWKKYFRSRNCYAAIITIIYKP